MDKHVHSALRIVYYNSLVSDNVHKSTSQVDTGQIPPVTQKFCFSQGSLVKEIGYGYVPRER